MALLAAKLKVSSGHVTVELRCAGSGLCAGTLKLSAKHAGGGRHHKRSTTETIGQASFTILPEMSASVNVALNAAGKALLAGGHGKLKALLEVLGAGSTARQHGAAALAGRRPERLAAAQEALTDRAGARRRRAHAAW